MLETRIAEILVELDSPDGPTEEGRAILDEWLAQSNENQAFLNTVTSDESIISDLKVFMGMDVDVLLKKMEARLLEPLSEPDPVPVPAHKPSIRRLAPYLAAAVVLGCLILTYLLKAPGKENPTAKSFTGGHTDYFYQKAPDSGSVRLTLGDGNVVDLDGVHEKWNVRQGSVLAKVEGDRLLQYASDHMEKVMPDATTPGIIYNTLLAPYGNRYKLKLSDGTKATLNAGSSIRYPIAFAGSERVVEITGEVYFDVAKDDEHPFKVKTMRNEVQVLGTSFTIMDYLGEANSKVVVETGRVSLRAGKNAPTILNSAELADVANNGNVSVTSGINLKHELAWKEDDFNFSGLDIKDALGQIAQSYHTRILFDGNIKSGKLGSGVIQRDLPLETLLQDLELPDLHLVFNKEENMIVVKR